MRDTQRKQKIELFKKWLEKNIEKYISSHGLEGEDYCVNKGALAKAVYLHFTIKLKKKPHKATPKISG